MSAYILMISFKFLFEFPDRKGKMGMMFSCMVVLLSIAAFLGNRGKKITYIILKFIPTPFFPKQVVSISRALVPDTLVKWYDPDDPVSISTRR